MQAFPRWKDRSPKRGGEGGIREMVVLDIAMYQLL